MKEERGREGGREERKELDNTCLLLTRGGSFHTGVAPGGSFRDMGGGGGIGSGTAAAGLKIPGGGPIGGVT